MADIETTGPGKANTIRSIGLDKLISHPDNPNVMSKANFARLVRNIERTGRYEPLVVRPHRTRPGFFEIINGHHRCKALAKLGRKEADAVVWDVDDEQTAILLATLNRLGGKDELDKKLELLKRLNERHTSTELAKLIPQTAKQIERLMDLKLPSEPGEARKAVFATALVFFVSDGQKAIIDEAIALAEVPRSIVGVAAKRAAALAAIAERFLGRSKPKALEEVDKPVCRQGQVD